MTQTIIPDARDLKPWRYLPQETMTTKGWSSIVKSVWVPKQMRTDGDGPINKDMGMLICYCANGERRFHGFVDARINSELRMTVYLFDFQMERDEVIRKWEVCTTV